MLKRSIYLPILFVVLLVLLITGCNEVSPQEPSEEEKYTVGLSWNRRDEALIIAWEDYLKIHGEEYGLEFVVNVADGDPMRQNANIEDFISQGVDVIVARAEDGASIGSAIADAKDAGIPFLTFDRESQTETPDAHVGASSYELAHEAALAFAELLKKEGVEGKCIELQGDLRDQNAIYFHDGWTDAENEEGAWTTVAAMPTEWNPEKFRSGVVNGFQANPDANCLFVASDFAFDAVRSGLEEVGRYVPVGEDGHVWVVTVGLQPPALDPIREGYIDVVAIWDAWYHAEEAAEVIHRLALGEDLGGEVFLVSGRIATPDNYESLEHVWGFEYEE